MDDITAAYGCGSESEGESNHKEQPQSSVLPKPIETEEIKAQLQLPSLAPDVHDSKAAASRFFSI